MTNRDRQSLLDILQCAELVAQYLAGKTEAMFLEDVLLQDAIVRRLEIVGEAARRLSPEARSELSQIDWSGAIGMRNIMIHQYDNLELDTVWDTATLALPELARKIQSILS